MIVKCCDLKQGSQVGFLEFIAHSAPAAADLGPFGGGVERPVGSTMPVKIPAVHPVLMARDVTASIAFYVRLGFVATFRDDPDAPRYAVVRRGPVELHLQWADSGQWAHQGDSPAYRFPTTDVDTLYAEFVAAEALAAGESGGPWAKPADTPWGTREFHLRDPGRNVLQFYCLLQAASGQNAESSSAADGGA
jgi:catechol 2,3-dioxygenase-like lactoylglutathione lyase family enzyme